jgi:putative methionine-R-sulfoxide reductase with GAF domain
MERKNTHIPFWSSELKRVPALGWIFIILLMIDVGFSIMVFSDEKRWQGMAYIISVAITIGLFVPIVGNLWRGYKFIAGVLILIALLIRGWVSAFVFDHLGFTMQIFILSFGIAIILEWFPSHTIRRALSLYFLLSLFVLATDWVGLPWQIHAYSTGINLNFAIIFIAVMFIATYLIRSYPSYPLTIKLILLLLGLSLFSIIGGSIVTSFILQQSANADSRQILITSVDNLSESVDRFLNHSLRKIQLVASMPELVAYLETSSELQGNADMTNEIGSLLLGISRADLYAKPTYILLDRRGIVVADSSGERTGQNNSFRSYFFMPLLNGKPFVSSIYSPQSIDEPALNISAPVLNRQDQIIGVLNVQYKPEIIQTLLTTQNDVGTQVFYGVLLDENNVVIGHTEAPDFVGNKVILPFDAMLEGYLKNTQTIGKQPEDASAAVKRVNGGAWKAISFQPASLMNRTLTEASNAVVLIAESIVIIVIIVGNIGAKYFFLPIAALTQTVNKISHGNFLVTAKVTGKDEISELAAAFNKISQQLTLVTETITQRAETRTRIIEAASRVNRAIASVSTLDMVVAKCVDELRNVKGYHFVSLYLADPGNRQLIMVAPGCNSKETLVEKDHFVAYGDGLVGLAALDQQTIFASNAQEHPHWVINPNFPESASEIAVPIRAGKDLLGVLSVQQNQRGSLTDQDVVLLELVASQLSNAMRNAIIISETQNEAEMQFKLNKISEHIRSTGTVNEALQVALREIALLTGSKKIGARLKVGT